MSRLRQIVVTVVVETEKDGVITTRYVPIHLDEADIRAGQDVVSWSYRVATMISDTHNEEVYR